MARVQGISARICTWELVTGFGQNPTEEELAGWFCRDFPGIDRQPKFWKLLSFNSSEGRRHRYLVILVGSLDQSSRRRFQRRRTLPCSLFLYARADALMRACEGNGNFRYAALVGGALYVLVFYEGRLCHWSEERGYGGTCGKEMARNRLLRIDEFLRLDSLFSAADSFRYGELEELEVNYDDSVGVWADLFQKAAKDPFWKGLHLESQNTGRRFVFPVMLFFLLMMAGPLLWNIFDVDCGVQPGPKAPALTPPATEVVSKEPRSGDIMKSSHPKSADAAPDCPRPSLEISGIVGNRLFSGVFGGERIAKKMGDSLGRYQVKSVLRDRVVLECGGNEWEVVNGAVP